MEDKDRRDSYVQWHADYQPDPHPQVGDIYSGLRGPSGGEESEISNIDTHYLSPCQYWVKYLPNVCLHFNEDKCGLDRDSDGKYPTGYNGGCCDYLGRRNWCNRYTYDETGGPTTEGYVCVAPDMFRTGLGKRDPSVTTHLVLLPYSKAEILGYNDMEGDGVGRCDGLGMGRSAAGIGITNPEKMCELPLLCRHYKPWVMGFGAIKPRPMGTAVLEGKNVYDGSEADPLSDMGRHLPFLFRMLNMRAQYQKCAYWDQDYGTLFEIDYSGGYASIVLPEDPLTECTCNDEKSTKYKTIIGGWPENVSDMLVDVLTEDYGIVCNGANSECPCYTGKWTFCVPTNMRDGMRITAEQILELRFWMAVWQTQEIYDNMFAEKSGPNGITTSDLFTFDKWEKLGTLVEDSVMRGKRIYQCFPIPYNQREFDPLVYLTKDAVVYPKAKASTGTLTEELSNFPTLVRKIGEDETVPVLDVIYPYPCEDPWGVTPCDQVSVHGNMELASCKLESPEIAAFGYTIKDKDVYILNLDKLEFGYMDLLKDKTIALLSAEDYLKVTSSLHRLIESSLEDAVKHKYITTGMSNKYGYFGVGPIELDYDVTTNVGIVCRVNAGAEKETSDYEMVIRKVDTKFYGGTIIQDSFTFEYGGEDDDEEEGGGGSYIVTLPTYFSPPATIEGSVHLFGGDFKSIFPVYSQYKYGTMQDSVQYSYCVNEYTIDDQNSKSEILKWVRIGPTGYIWAFLDNIDVSYLFDFEVTSATIQPSGDKELTDLCMGCGDTAEEGQNNTIVLEVVHPKVDDPDAIKRKHKPPDCVILKSASPQGFFNEDWQLRVGYKYKILEPKSQTTSEDVTIAWPIGMGEEGSMHKLVDAPFSWEPHDDGSFKIENIRTGTIELMLYVADDDSRVQAATSTKMLLDVVTTKSRNVEIYYNYSAAAVKYALQPTKGDFIWKGSDKPIGECTHVNTPQCGDHDLRGSLALGPVWFPFSVCQTYDYYNFCQGPSVCVLPIEGSTGGSEYKAGYRTDYRYRMADQYQAYTGTGSLQWAATCKNGWSYYYSEAGDSQFSGYGKIRTSVYAPDYVAEGGALPPFGNMGREITERWLSQEYCGFWDLSGIRPVPKAEYMPLVMDDAILFTSFDAFEEQGRLGPIKNYFHTTCMLNYMTSGLISEKIVVTYENTSSAPAVQARFRFEEIFSIITHGMCMYPYPLYGDVLTSVKRYSFGSVTVNKKETRNRPTGGTYEVLVPETKKVAWAWREYWKSIERGILSDTLNFVNFNRPQYCMDFEKTEHRLIIDEGDVDIIFIPPEVSGNSYTLPSISIQGGQKRKFKIIYDDYNDEQVEWVDEGGDDESGSSGWEFIEGSGGKVAEDGTWYFTESDGYITSYASREDYAAGNGVVTAYEPPKEGSSEEDDASIYEKAMGAEWFHDANTIFDADASPEKSDDRKVIVGETTTKWYNRGLIANIPRNRLGYLPYKLEDEPVEHVVSREHDATDFETYVAWYNDDPLRPVEVCFTYPSACITRVNIRGRMGIKTRDDFWFKAGVYCRPEIEISEYAMGDDILVPEPPTVLYRDRGQKGDKDTEAKWTDCDTFDLEINLSKFPKRVLHSTKLFKVRLTLFPNQHLMLRRKDGMLLWPGEYVTQTETIHVWERKYIVSSGEFGDKNPDGKESETLRSYDRDRKNAGQYFPAGVNSPVQESIKMRDKMTVVGADIQYQSDIDLDVNKGNLKTIEATEQMKLYSTAYELDSYDEFIYTKIIPPNVQQFFAAANVGGPFGIGINGNCIFKAEKLPWDKHLAVSGFQQDGSFWQAGGHFYKWGPDIFKASCMVIGPIETIYEPVFVHVNHAGGKEVEVMDPGHALRGWARLEYYEGKLWQSLTHGEQVTAHQGDLLTGASLNSQLYETYY